MGVNENWDSFVLVVAYRNRLKRPCFRRLCVTFRQGWLNWPAGHIRPDY